MMGKDVWRRLRSKGHTCGAPAASTGRPCRRVVLDGGLCAQHAPSDDDCTAAQVAFARGYGYAHDDDGWHLIYLDSGRRLTFSTLDQLTTHCGGSA